MNFTRTQERTLEQLQSQWHALEVGGSRLVVIHGAPGSGKTALVHEFYRRVVSDASGGFWPSDISTPELPRERARKRVRPEAAADPLGAMPFAWLGRTCQPGEDEAASVADIAQLVSDQVAQALYVNLNQGMEVGEDAIVVLLAFLSAGGAGLILGPAGFTLGAAMSWASFGHRLARLARLVVSEEAQWQRADQQLGRIPWAPMPTRNSVIIRRLERLAVLDLPTVLALEDAHHAGEAAVTLCRAALASAGTQVLIVATADAGPLVDQMAAGAGFGSLLASEPAGKIRPLSIAIGDLAQSELERIVVHHAPLLERDVVRTIVGAAGLNIEAAVALAERIGSGLGHSDEQPGEAMRRLRWADLEDGLRCYLSCVAALQGEVWYADQPLDAIARLTRAGYKDAQARALAERLLVSVDKWRLAFVDRHWHEFAKDRVSELVSADQVAACRLDLFDSITADKADPEFWEGLPAPVRATLLRTHCGLYPDPTDDQLDDIGVELLDSWDQLAGTEASVDNLVEATRAAARAVDLVGLIRRKGGFVEAQQEIQVQARYAYLPVAGRELGELLEEAKVFTQTMADEHGPNSIEWLTAPWNEACMHAAVYDFTTASQIAGATIAVATEASTSIRFSIGVEIRLPGQATPAASVRRCDYCVISSRQLWRAAAVSIG